MKPLTLSHDRLNQDRMKPNNKELFEEKIDYNGPSQLGGSCCWLWKAFKNSEGYGVVGWRGKILGAHRVAYALSVGIDPLTLESCQVVRHICNNPSCVNPYHLALGTHADNAMDKVRSGRSAYTGPRGDDHGNTKIKSLVKQKIGDQYLSGKSQRQLAIEYGISQSLVSLIVTSVTKKKHTKRRGRIQTGENNNHVKLTKQDVIEIRERCRSGNESHEKIASFYGISRTVVTRINNGTRWGNVK